MKKIAVIILLLPIIAYSQKENTDSLLIKAYGLNKNMTTRETFIDSSLSGFQVSDFIYRQTFSASSLGNFASPFLSNIYAQRTEDIFPIATTKPLLYNAGNTLFFKTRVPFSNLLMYIGPEKEVGISFLHTQNINPYNNFSFRIDGLNAPGIYTNQQQIYNSGNFTTWYQKSRYFLLAAMNINKEKHLDAGGVINPKYVEDTLVNPRQIGFKLSNANSKFNHNNWILNAGINLIDAANQKDTNIIAGYLTLFSGANLLYYQFRYNDNNPVYTDENTQTIHRFYNNTFFTPKTEDILEYELNIWHAGIKLNMLPGMVFPLTAFIKANLWHEKVYNDASGFQSLQYRQQSAVIETGLYTNPGAMKAQVNLQQGLTGYRKNHTEISALMTTTTPENRINISLFASYQKKPEWFYQCYVSNHFKWFNSFDAIQKINYGTEFELLRQFVLRAEYFGLKNHIYIDDTLPVQAGKQINLISLSGSLKLKAEPFYSATRFAFQFSENLQVLSLPKFCVYQSVYYQSIWFKKVLTVQSGLDMRYNAQFYSPQYIPSLGIFVPQKQKQTGNYPVIDVFVNFQVTRARIFFKFEHVNYGLFTNNEYSTFDYPLTGRVFRTGISWNFYD